MSVLETARTALRWYDDPSARPNPQALAEALRGMVGAEDARLRDASRACPECRRADGEHKLDCGRRHTPTDDERDSPVEGMENGFEPWVGAFDAPTEAGDEREALIEEATWRLIEWDTDTADRGVRDEHYQDRRADVERIFPILAARFHRTVQGEPSDAAVAIAELEREIPDAYVDGSGEPVLVLTERSARTALVALRAAAATGGARDAE